MKEMYCWWSAWVRRQLSHHSSRINWTWFHLFQIRNVTIPRTSIELRTYSLSSLSKIIVQYASIFYRISFRLQYISLESWSPKFCLRQFEDGAPQQSLSFNPRDRTQRTVNHNEAIKTSQSGLDCRIPAKWPMCAGPKPELARS